MPAAASRRGAETEDPLPARHTTLSKRAVSPRSGLPWVVIEHDHTGDHSDGQPKLNPDYYRVSRASAVWQRRSTCVPQLA